MHLLDWIQGEHRNEGHKIIQTVACNYDEMLASRLIQQTRCPEKIVHTPSPLRRHIILSQSNSPHP